MCAVVEPFYVGDPLLSAPLTPEFGPGFARQVIHRTRRFKDFYAGLVTQDLQGRGDQPG